MRKNMERKSAKTKNFLQNSQGKKQLFSIETQAKTRASDKDNDIQKKVITKKKIHFECFDKLTFNHFCC